MSKKNKVVYSNVQPNTKEAGIWVNTDNGNISIAENDKWKGGNTQHAPAEKITFTVMDSSGYEITYTAEKGMTWKQFIGSEYDVDNWMTTEYDEFVYIYYIDYGPSGGESHSLTYVPPLTGVTIGAVGNAVRVNDFILADHTYGKEFDSWGIGPGIG